MQKYGREPISLHTPLGEDGDSEFGDLIEDSEAIQPDEAVSFTLLQEQLHSVLGTLSEREAGVVSMRFGLTDGRPKTLDEIGRVYGVTRERIRQAITRAMADQARTIRLPVHMAEAVGTLARARRQMLQDLGREPTPAELAAGLGMTPERVIEVQKYGREPISLHTPLGEDGGSELGGLIEDGEADPAR